MAGAAGGEGQVELGGEKSDRASLWQSRYMCQLVAASGDSAAMDGEVGGDGERETCGDGWRLVHSSSLAVGEEDWGEGVQERRGEEWATSGEGTAVSRTDSRLVSRS